MKTGPSVQVDGMDAAETETVFRSRLQGGFFYFRIGTPGKPATGADLPGHRYQPPRYLQIGHTVFKGDRIRNGIERDDGFRALLS